MHNNLERKLNGKSKPLDRSIYLLGMISMFFSFSGMSTVISVNNDAFFATASASVYAIGTGIAIPLFWIAMYHFVPYCTNPQKRVMAIGLMLGSIPFIIALSGWPNVAALVGRAAQQQHIEQSINQAAMAIEASYVQSQAIGQLIPDLDVQIDSLSNKANSELTTGAYTGVPGTGLAHSALTSMAGDLTTLRESIQAQLVQTNIVKQTAQEQLDQMRQASVQEGTPDERMQAVFDHGDQLRVTLTQLNTSGFNASASRILEQLPQAVNQPTKPSSNPEVAKAQQRVIEKLREDAEQTSQVLRGFTQQLAAQPAISLPAMESMSTLRAVQVYYRQFIPSWLGGIALDLVWLPIILALTIMRANKTERELLLEQAKHITVVDAYIANLLSDMLRQSSTDQKTLEDLRTECLEEKDQRGKRK